MKTNKMSIFVTFVIAIFSISLALYSQNTNNNFLENICIGMFSSSMLAMIMAIIGYFNDRRKTLEKFYIYSNKAAVNFNKFENNGNLEQSIDTVLLIGQFDYIELDNAYGDIDFIVGNRKKRKYIYDKIYFPILKARDLITEKNFHFKIYKKSRNGNQTYMKLLIGEIDNEFMLRTVQNFENDGGEITTITSEYNCIAKDLEDELSGEYYNIMYPFKKFKKEEEVNNET